MKESRIVVGGPDLDAVRALLREYADWLAVDLSFQGFAEEIAGLPGEYQPPAGALFLCLVERQPAGCVAVHPWRNGACEIKRLYVRQSFQGQGCGHYLAEQAIAWARRAGYEQMLLDTLPTMTTAQRMYERLGFREVGPYRFNPISGTRYLALPLAAQPEEPAASTTGGH
jgi:GNAT superfamily N-acetyltransferase